MSERTNKRRASAWRILMVDDEPDIHAVTRMSIRRKKWRNRSFHLTSAYSAAEAMQILSERQDFHVALVDVVMETDHAGLDLCQGIRQTCPRSMRIVLRTGQAGIVPEETVLNEYDIDYYLTKSETTPDKLFSAIRACLRSSQDISTLIAFGRQIQRFTRSLQSVTTVDDLLLFMKEALQFLELKYSAKTAFCYNIANLPGSLLLTNDADASHPRMSALLQGMRGAYTRQLTMFEAHQGSEVGLDPGTILIPFVTGEGEATEFGMMALVSGILPDIFDDKSGEEFLADALLFIENWRIAYSSLRLKQQLAREQMLREQMYHERAESIANMVTGIAHELNTPIGIARTSSGILTELTTDIISGDLDDDEEEELIADLRHTCELMERNLERARRLITSFKKLSASQFSNENQEHRLVDVIQDSLESSTPLLKKKQITWSLDIEEGLDDSWFGHSGHLSQVLLNLIQNTERYAYERGDQGTILVSVQGEEGRFRICFSDKGRGVKPDILPKIFEPFVTSGRDLGGTGLGLAISHNIVTNLLGGTIHCESALGEGTDFIIKLPTGMEDATEQEA